MRTDKRTHRARILSAIFALGLSSMAWLFGGASSAQAANVGIKVHILNPPNPITDLSAAPVGSQDGDVQLAWTAPSNDNQIAINHYFVRFATFPAPSTLLAESWWNTAAATQLQVSPAFAPGTQEFTTVQGLTIGVTYYFGIKAVDKDGMISPVDLRVGQSNQAQSLPLSVGSIPSTPTNFAGTPLSQASIQWTWDNTPLAGFYALTEFPSGSLIAQTTGLTLIEAGLNINTPYSRRLAAGNGNGMSAPTLVQTVYTQAVIPTNPTLTNVMFTTITVNWLANGNPTGTQYRLERSNDGVNFVVQTLTTSLTYEDGGLTELTTYYYRVLAVNGDGVATSPSVVVSTVTPQQIDFTPPAPVLGLRADVDASHKAFTLTWEPVTRNADGTPITDLVGYNIYRHTTIRGTATLLNPLPITVTAFADQVDGQTYYYTVRAVDTSDNQSSESYIADSSENANIIFLGQDDKSMVVIPNDVSDLLRSAFNKHNTPILIEMSEEPVANNTAIVRNIRFRTVRADSGQEVKDLAFDKPLATVSVGYSQINGQIALGSPKPEGLAAQQTPQMTTATPEQLSLYWNNGVTWVKIGGTLDKAAEVLSTKSSFVGSYQLRIVPSATSLTLSKANVFPRTFTPNGDGFNDRVYFVLENPNDTEVKGEILDMEGRLVRTLPAPTSQSGIGTTLTWDGKDQAGSVVPSGVYIYRVMGEGKTFTGTVVVAR